MLFKPCFLPRPPLADVFIHQLRKQTEQTNEMKAVPKISSHVLESVTKAARSQKASGINENCILAVVGRSQIISDTWKLQQTLPTKAHNTHEPSQSQTHKGILIMRIVYTKQSKCHKFYNSLTFPSRPEPNPLQQQPQAFLSPQKSLSVSASVADPARVSMCVCDVLCHWLSTQNDADKNNNDDRQSLAKYP